MLLDEYEIMEAGNGLQAIKLLEFHQFEISLILLDIIMPEMDGFEVLAMMNKMDGLNGSRSSSFQQKRLLPI